MGSSAAALATALHFEAIGNHPMNKLLTSIATLLALGLGTRQAGASTDLLLAALPQGQQATSSQGAPGTAAKQTDSEWDLALPSWGYSYPAASVSQPRVNPNTGGSSGNNAPNLPPANPNPVGNPIVVVPNQIPPKGGLPPAGIARPVSIFLP